MNSPENIVVDNTPIYIFWHIFIDKERSKRAEGIIKRQFDKIKNSGLLDRCDTLYIGYVSTLDFPFDEIINNPKVKIIVRKDIGYEGITTTALKKFCDIQTEKSLIMYIHTRGISQPDNSPSEDWTLMMEYFVIERWKQSIQILKDKYTAGCELWAHTHRTNPSDFIYHYSGNFWWARSEYIKLLEYPISYAKNTYEAMILGPHAVNCIESEDWILQLVEHGINKELFGILHRTSRDRYKRGMVHSYIDRYPLMYYMSGSEVPDIEINPYTFNGEGCMGK